MAADPNKIKQIDDFLDQGITSTSVDGQSASFDLDFIQKRNSEKKAHNPSVCQGTPRVPFYNPRIIY